MPEHEADEPSMARQKPLPLAFLTSGKLTRRRNLRSFLPSGDETPDQFELLRECERWKFIHGPKMSEIDVFRIALSLGYHKMGKSDE